MDLRTYKAKSLAEALRLVREDLGPEASLLHTRHRSDSTWNWLLGGAEFEVTASCEVQAPSLLADHSHSPPRADLLDFRSQFREHLRKGRPRPEASVEELAGSLPPGRHEAGAAALDRVGRLLVEQRFDCETVRRWIDELHGHVLRGEHRFGPLCSLLVNHIAGRIAVGGPIQSLPASRHVVALVGPTGVGKTTTVAKLAAGFRAQHKRVGLIAADNVRIAAVEQLRAYAELLKLPMEVAADGSCRQALERLAQTDVVLIDTAGCSPGDEDRVQRLSELLRQSSVDEIHLVHSAVSSPHGMARAREAFGMLRPRALILTKLDELASPGTLWPLVSDRSLPVSYVTDGQNVPRDIGIAARLPLAELLLGQRIADAAPL